MSKIIKPKSIPWIVVSFLIPAFFTLLRPMHMDLNQSFVIGSLFLVILWWGTGWVHKDIASGALLLVFLLFGHTPVQQVLFFPLSENILIIVAAYLLSQGIVNSKVADNFSHFLLDRYCKNSTRTVIITFILCSALIFIIPQPFPRVVMLSAIYMNFLRSRKVEKEQERVLLFCIFVAATVTSLLFMNGDVIANYAALGFGKVGMPFFDWVKYMTLPTAVVTAIIAAAFILVFKKDLKDGFSAKGEKKDLKISADGKKALIVMAVIAVLWLTEPLHKVSAAVTALLGALTMFILRIISIKDFKSINLSLLLFLTAEFSIGRVLVASGVAEHIRDFLMTILPATESVWFLPVIVLCVMALHMIMGSIITALSFSIPMLIIIVNGAFPPAFIALLVLVSVAFHYMLPFHHVTIIIGYGSGYYENRHVMKFGLVLTIITFVSVFLLYIPWWKITGLLK